MFENYCLPFICIWLPSKGLGKTSVLFSEQFSIHKNLVRSIQRRWVELRGVFYTIIYLEVERNLYQNSPFCFSQSFKV